MDDELFEVVANDLPEALLETVEHMVTTYGEEHREQITDGMIAAYVLGMARGIRTSIERLRPNEPHA